jgi:hypothetical protein
MSSMYDLAAIKNGDICSLMTFMEKTVTCRKGHWYFIIEASYTGSLRSSYMKKLNLIAIFFN